MKNKKTIFLLCLGALVLTACSHDEKHSSKIIYDTNQKVILANTPSIPFFDSTITFENLPGLEDQKSSFLDSALAIKIFERHFKKERCLVNGELAKSKSDYGKLQATYDTIYNIDYKSAKAIISYWITPYGASGHCYQPHHAIIVNSKNGYSIIKEDFIPDNFYIDSVKDGVQQAYIYGCDFDCSDNKRLRNFKITIK